MIDRSSDAELVTAHLAGDSGALAAIYDRYADALYDTAAAMLSDRHEAEDLTHDVFVVASRSLGQLRDVDRLKPWLFAILRHEAYRRSKRRARSRPTDFTETGVGEMTATDDPAGEGADVERDELAAFVRAAAAGLAERDQLLLELSVRQGLAGADLAAAVGVSPEQCHVLVHRMRERVQRSLGALTVARYGRKDCPDLQTLLQKWNGVFDPPTRKRIAGHIDDCSVCSETSRKYAVVPLLAAAPAFAAPASLRDRVLASTALSVGEHPDTGVAEMRYRFDAHGGFPRLARDARRTIVATAIAVTLVLLLGGTWLALASGDGIDAVDAGPARPSAAGDATPPTPPTPPTSSTPPTAPVTTGLSTGSSATSAAPDSSIASSTGSSQVPTTVPSASTPSSTTTTTSPGSTSTTTTVTPATAPPTDPPSPTPTPAPTQPPPPPPPPPAPVAPGRLTLSSGRIDLGPSAPNAIVRLSNAGGQALDWSIVGDAAPFTLSAVGGALAPGGAVDVTVALDRAPLAEGDLAAALTVVSSGDGSAALDLAAAVEHPPVVTVASATSSLVCPYTLGAPMRVTVTDESAIGSVVLSWSGPGAPGSVAMRRGPTGWSGRVTPEPVNGTWTWVATATDARGNTGTAGSIVVVVGC